MKEIYINCSCGGGASVKIPAESTTAVTECACGKMLLWSGEAQSPEWLDNPPKLGIFVSDDVKTEDKFGA
jgi:hypothetical protein